MGRWNMHGDDFSRKHPGLAGRAFPDRSGKLTADVGGGVRLGYQEYYDEGQADMDQLQPVVLIPGSPG